MNALIITAIGLGLATNFHCMGMCGPIAFALPVNNANTRTKTFGILAYNIGRIFTYVFLGAVFGLFGKGLQLAGVSRWVSITIGILFLLYVFVPSVLQKFQTSNRWYVQFNNYVKGRLGSRLKKKSLSSLFVLGMLNGMLPCGMVYAAIFAAIGFGEGVQGGMLFMLFFGLGTLPAMFGLPFVAQSISQAFRRKFTKAVPVMMVLFGVLFILRGMNLGIPYVSPPISKTEIHDCCSKPK